MFSWMNDCTTLLIVWLLVTSPILMACGFITYAIIRVGSRSEYTGDQIDGGVK